MQIYGIIASPMFDNAGERRKGRGREGFNLLRFTYDRKSTVKLTTATFVGRSSLVCRPFLRSRLKRGSIESAGRRRALPRTPLT